MSDVIYRPSRPGDEEQLKYIWAAAYEGDTLYSGLFFDRVYRPGIGMVADVDGTLTSCIYYLDGYTVHFPGEHDRKAAYLYALGTPEEYRGKGYGGEVSRAIIRYDYELGNDYVFLLPASESLYHWYERILGSYTVFYRREIEVKRVSEPVSGRITPITPEEYQQIRSDMLKAYPYTEPSMEGLSLQAEFCRVGGGGIYRFELDGRTGLAAADREEDVLTFREFLFPDGDPIRGGRLFLQELDAQSAVLRTPAFWHEGIGKVTDDNILLPGGSDFPKTELPPYWGVSLD